MPGRPAKPAELHVLQGTRSESKHLAASPFNPPRFAESPEPPDTLGEHASEVWNEYAPLLAGSGVLRATDLPVFEAYCVAVATFRLAAKQVQKYGPLIMGEKGAVKNPAATVMREQQAEIRQLSTLLGMNPAARQKIGGDDGSVVADPWDDL